MTSHSIDYTESNNQLQNWDNFCHYHLGNWHGIWTKYSPEGQAIDSFKCVRSFHLSEDGSQIAHQNDYTYADGKTELKNIGPYIKPVVGLSFANQYFSILFLDNSFSWGKTAIAANAPSACGFETGFRYGNSRISIAVVYEQSGELQHITTICEQLDSFLDALPAPGTIEPASGLRGTLKQMTPDLATSSAEEIEWQPLENLGGNNRIFHLPGGSISCPAKIEGNSIMDLIIEWQATPNKLFRGIRHFDNFEFSRFLLQVYES